MLPTSTKVKVFKGTINLIESEINTWVQFTGARVLNTSMTYDEKGQAGHVFVLVVYEPKN